MYTQKTMEQTIAMLALLQQAESYDCEIAALTAKLAEVTALKKAAIADAKALRKAAAAEQAAERLRERHEARVMAGEDVPMKTERIEVSKIANMLEEMYVKLGIEVGTAKSRRETIKEAKRIFNEFQKTILRQERTAMRSIETVEPARPHDLRRERFAMSSIVVEHTERARTASEELAQEHGLTANDVIAEVPEVEVPTEGRPEVEAGPCPHAPIYSPNKWSECDLDVDSFLNLVDSTKWQDLHWQAKFRYVGVHEWDFNRLPTDAQDALKKYLDESPGYPNVGDFDKLKISLTPLRAVATREPLPDFHSYDRSKPDIWKHEYVRTCVWGSCDLTTTEFNELISTTKWHDLHWQAMLRFCGIDKSEFGSLNPRARGQLVGWLKSLDGYPQQMLMKNGREINDFEVLRKVLEAVKALPEASGQDQAGPAQS